MTDGLDQLLADLPDPTPPAALAATVLARIARQPDADSIAGAVRSGGAIPSVGPAWFCTGLGVLVVAGLAVPGWAEGVPADVVSPLIGLNRVVLVPAGGPGVLLLAAGLWLFLWGLFGPLRLDRKV